MECWKVLRRNNLSPPKQLDFQMLSVQNPKQSYTRAVARFFVTRAGGGGGGGRRGIIASSEGRGLVVGSGTP